MNTLNSYIKLHSQGMKLFSLMGTLAWWDFSYKLFPGNIDRIISKFFDIFPKLFPRISKHQRNYHFFFAIYGMFLNYTKANGSANLPGVFKDSFLNG